MGDDRADVIRNRELLYKQISQTKSIAPTSKWIFLDQVHENKIVSVGPSFYYESENPPLKIGVKITLFRLSYAKMLPFITAFV